MENGEIRRLVLRTLYELGTGEYGDKEILSKTLALEPRLTEKELLGEDSSYENSAFL
jgi:hypothetical protein